MKKFVLLGLIFANVACSLGMTKPEVKMQSFAIEKFTEKTIDLNVTLEVKNPNYRDLEIEKLKYGFQLNDSAFFHQELGSNLEISGNSTKKIDLPIKIPTETLVGAVFDMLVNKPMNYNFVGSLRVNGFNVAFNKSGTMPKRDSL